MGVAAACFLLGVGCLLAYLVNRGAAPDAKQSAGDGAANPDKKREQGVQQGAQKQQPLASAEDKRAGAKRQAGKRVLWILAPKDFWWLDYEPVTKILQEGGVEVEVASTIKGEAKAMNEQRTARIDYLIDEVDVAQFDALIICGGHGAKIYVDDGRPARSVQKLIHDMLDRDKGFVTALGMGSPALAQAGVLANKKATGYKPVKWMLEQKKGIYLDQPVVVDGRIITGRDWNDAKEFARSLLEALQKMP
jgi:protease I